MAETLAGMPLERAFVVHGEPGWDEATPVGDFVLFDVRPGKVAGSSAHAPRTTARALRPRDLAAATPRTMPLSCRACSAARTRARTATRW